MVNISTIFSSVQNEINDIEMVRIQPGEYTDFMNQVMNTIAQETELYLGRYSTVPKPLVASPDTNVVVIPEVDPLTNNILQPYRLERVLRQTEDLSKFMETREYSKQTIASTYSGNRSFQGISNIVDRGGFASHHTNPTNNNTVDGSLVLFFTKNFAVGEQVIIDFMQEVPFTVTKWNDVPALSVPEYLRTAVEAMLLEKVTRRLFNKGDESFGGKWQMASMVAKDELHRAKAYIQNFKDKRSVYQMKPSSWLDERRITNPS